MGGNVGGKKSWKNWKIPKSQLSDRAPGGPTAPLVPTPLAPPVFGGLCLHLLDSCDSKVAIHLSTICGYSAPPRVL